MTPPRGILESMGTGEGSGEAEGEVDRVPWGLRRDARVREDHLVREEDLLRRVRGGDRDAFAPLVEAHLPRVWSVVWRILRHREDTEDVVQEVFLAAFQSLPSFRGEASLSTWLHRIAVTRTLNHLDRSEERVRRASQALEDGLGAVAGGRSAASPAPIASLRSPDPSPLKALEAGEIRRRLAECLRKLPAAWRAVLTLRDVDRVPYEEIARLSGIALGTVRSRLARARLSLRECMEAGR
jgi:RNA polymerase sigma-70 factor (ECF subfamily)